MILSFARQMETFPSREPMQQNHSSFGVRYVGRKFALQICIANGRKAFAIDDGRVNRKKIAKICIK